MSYLSDLLDRDKLMACLDAFIFRDPGMRENNMQDVRRRVKNTFSSSSYINRLSSSRKNWLDMETTAVVEKLTAFLESL